MAISIKSEREIELMRHAGEVLAKTHQELAEYIKPGTTTWHINKIADEIIRSYSCIPSFLNYSGYPASVCISVNEEVVHGIPSKHTILKNGDIISIDIGALYNGYHGDSAKTHGVGDISEKDKELIAVTRQSFYEGFKKAVVGNRLSDISNAVQTYAESFGFSVIRDYVGHGVGENLHEDPQVPNYGKPGRGPRLQEGMVLAIEPMIATGTYKVKVLSDGWTAVTLDDKNAAHYEHTIAITAGEPELLTIL